MMVALEAIVTMLPQAVAALVAIFLAAVSGRGASAACAGWAHHFSWRAAAGHSARSRNLAAFT